MNSAKMLFASPLIALAVSALADNEIIGTVEMTLDGHRQTWYVLDPGQVMPPTAMWLAMGPERGALSIAAYESSDGRAVDLRRHVPRRVAQRRGRDDHRGSRADRPQWGAVLQRCDQRRAVVSERCRRFSCA